MVNKYIESNWGLIESIAKRVLKGRFREGISSYYMHMVKKNKLPKNAATHIYYYMLNLDKSRSDINYIPVMFRGGDIDNVKIGYDEWVKVDMMMDLNDAKLVDFLINNANNEKWIKIYEVLFSEKIKLNMFENILFDYIFNKGLSIRKIAKLTGNGDSYTYDLRKKLINKIREALKEVKKIK